MCNICLCVTETENTEALVMNFATFTRIKGKRRNIWDSSALHYFSYNLNLLSPPVNQYSCILNTLYIDFTHSELLIVLSFQVTVLIYFALIKKISLIKSSSESL